MSFLSELQATLSKYNLLNHKFYTYWNEGKLDKNILALYAKQYYHHVEAFPRALSAIHSNCDSAEGRKIILENLIEEENSEPNHPELWMNFANALGVSENDVKEADIDNKTRELLNAFKECSRSSYEEGLGSLYAHEWQYSEIAKTKKEGLIKYYNIKDEKNLEFFSVHSTIDVWHSEQLVSLIEKVEEEKQAQIMKGAISSAKALWGFLDGMLEHYNA